MVCPCAASAKRRVEPSRSRTPKELSSNCMNSNFIFSPVGEDPVAAVKSGALMAIGADHGRYASGLSGSAKTINLG